MLTAAGGWGGGPAVGPWRGHRSPSGSLTQHGAMGGPGGASGSHLCAARRSDVGRQARGSCGPARGAWFIGVEVFGLLQAGIQPASDHGPALALAVIGEQAIRPCRRVQRVLDLGLLERSGRDPSAQRPGGVIERAVPPA